MTWNLDFSGIRSVRVGQPSAIRLGLRLACYTTRVSAAQYLLYRVQPAGRHHLTGQGIKRYENGRDYMERRAWIAKDLPTQPPGNPQLAP